MHLLLHEFHDLFQEPTTLPPQRPLDHAIHLKPNTEPVNIRSYRYNPAQKTEIEKQVKDMLTNSIIQPSQSPFASPIFLVKKKDGTWRFCIDYRQHNSLTIKNNFPIPIIEDLLDEINGAAIFSKLDLRLDYHQIRMRPNDIPKTAFRTHQGLYEFTVMPFGLTNAPTTFQALMNQTLSPYLRKFILVFFDDILVYSPTLQTHPSHLQTTFEVLRIHRLYVKLSKCTFAQGEVEYLGHVILSKGVSTDSKKIEAMVN